MTQLDIILMHLKKAKTITMREALMDYSIQSLPKRMSELRQLGHKVLTVSKKHPTTGQRYATYSLAK